MTNNYEAMRYAVLAAMPGAVMMREVDRVISAMHDELHRQGWTVVPRNVLGEMRQQYAAERWYADYRRQVEAGR